MKKTNGLKLVGITLILAIILALPLSIISVTAEEESPIESIIVENDGFSIIENDRNYGYMKKDQTGYDGEGNPIFSEEYFYYPSSRFTPTITITYKDPELEPEILTNKNYYSEILQESVQFIQEFPQKHDSPWTVNNTYPVRAEIGGASQTFNIKIVESPVESITATNVIIIENDIRYGSLTKEIIGYDENTGEPIYSDNEYFHYDPYAIKPKTITIKYKDETNFGTEILTASSNYRSEILNQFIHFEEKEIQDYENRWVLGGTYQLRAEIVGKFAYFDVSIIEGTGWQEFDEKWYYFDENGEMATNKWVADTKGWCYLGEDGAMVTDKWVADKGYWYYLGSDGRMVRNKWVRDSVTWCYLGENGAMVTNQWKQDSKGYWYYLGANGRILIKKWFYYNGYWYYFDANGAMATNKWVADTKGWCYLDAKGKMVTNKWVRDTVTWCYIGADGRAVKNQWQKDSNGWCYLDENARLTIGWKQISGKWYYFNRNGTMVTGRQVIDGEVHIFDANGAWIRKN